MENPASLGHNTLARMIDHTLLRPSAQRGEITRLCQQALEWNFISVCISPIYVGLAHDILKGSATKVCTVIGFPHGMHTTSAKAFETARAIVDGATEIDMVIPVGALLEGDADTVWNDIRTVTDTAHQSGAILKVIIETCLLNDSQKELAARLVSDAGADFIKTSTGFSTGGATLHDIALLRSCCPPNVGVKASGGIRDTQTALAMIQAGANRIGTSNGIAILQGLHPDMA
jgi:deoxyribose-phosphate aldolase